MHNYNSLVRVGSGRWFGRVESDRKASGDGRVGPEPASNGGSPVGRAMAVESQITTEPRIAKPRAKGARPSRLREGLGVLLGALGAYVLVSVVSYHPLDPSFNSSLAGSLVHNRGGIVGAYLSDVLL